VNLRLFRVDAIGVQAVVVLLLSFGDGEVPPNSKVQFVSSGHLGHLIGEDFFFLQVLARLLLLSSFLVFFK